MTDYQAALQRVIDDVVAPNAAKVDTAGAFPAEALDALGQAGILGLPLPTAVGGGGGGLRQAADVVAQLSQVCGSTAMVMLMHYAASVVIDNHGPQDVRQAIGAGRHLTTLAFSESGSRSHFWAPQGTASGEGASVRLDASKSWVTSAGYADSYVWSSRPLADDGPMTLWLVPATAAGLLPGGPFDGLGLRGNSSTPISASGVVVGGDAMLGADGAGLDISMSEVLPMVPDHERSIQRRTDGGSYRRDQQPHHDDPARPPRTDAGRTTPGPSRPRPDADSHRSGRSPAQ